jgi:hypothetical protein
VISYCNVVFAVLQNRAYCGRSLNLVFSQCCGAENISFGSGSLEPNLRIAAPDNFIRYLGNDLFWLSVLKRSRSWSHNS